MASEAPRLEEWLMPNERSLESRLRGVGPRLQHLVAERPRQLVVSTAVFLVFVLVVVFDPRGGWGATIAVCLLGVLTYENYREARARADADAESAEPEED